MNFQNAQIQRGSLVREAIINEIQLQDREFTNVSTRGIAKRLDIPASYLQKILTNSVPLSSKKIEHIAKVLSKPQESLEVRKAIVARLRLAAMTETQQTTEVISASYAASRGSIPAALFSKLADNNGLLLIDFKEYPRESLLNQAAFWILHGLSVAMFQSYGNTEPKFDYRSRENIEWALHVRQLQIRVRQAHHDLLEIALGLHHQQRNSTSLDITVDTTGQVKEGDIRSRIVLYERSCEPSPSTGAAGQLYYSNFKANNRFNPCLWECFTSEGSDDRFIQKDTSFPMDLFLSPFQAVLGHWRTWNNLPRGKAQMEIVNAIDPNACAWTEYTPTGVGFRPSLRV